MFIKHFYDIVYSEIVVRNICFLAGELPVNISSIAMNQFVSITPELFLAVGVTLI